MRIRLSLTMTTTAVLIAGIGCAAAPTAADTAPTPILWVAPHDEQRESTLVCTPVVGAERR